MADIRAVRESDLSGIGEVLREWLVDPERADVLSVEADARIEQISGSLRSAGNARRYFVAIDSGGDVVGVAGLETEGVAPELHDRDERAAEVVMVYVRRKCAGQGIGRALVTSVERAAASAGFSVLLAVSGSRNRDSYGFWNRLYGNPVRNDPNYFGPGAECVVWRWALPSD